MLILRAKTALNVAICMIFFFNIFVDNGVMNTPKRRILSLVFTVLLLWSPSLLAVLFSVNVIVTIYSPPRACHNKLLFIAYRTITTVIVVIINVIQRYWRPPTFKEIGWRKEQPRFFDFLFSKPKIYVRSRWVGRYNCTICLSKHFHSSMYF